MKNALAHALRFTLGWVFVFVGLAGLVLPVLPGVVFLLLGFALLSGGSEKVRHWRDWLAARFSGHVERVISVKERLQAKLSGRGTP